MPRLISTETIKRAPTVDFIFSPALDMMNALYFTHLVVASEGVEGWPVRLRTEMAPDLLAELDFLFDFPNGEPGMMGQLTDSLFAHPESWDSIESLIDFVRNMPAGVGDAQEKSGIQGLAFYLCCIRNEPEPPLSDDPREALRLKLERDGADDIEAKLAQWDRPEELRERMINLIQRFYDEHYREELPRRRPLLERSVAAHRGIARDEALEVVRKILGRPVLCIDEGGVCADDFDKLIFSPSLDMGPYASCSYFEGPPSLHGMIYPLEAEFASPDTPFANDIQRSARLYKALSDEQRLRILYILGDREMYAQEIVDQLDVHQSVVSRHLSFLKAVGILRCRKQNSMKFFSVNPAIRDDINRPLAMFAHTGTHEGGTR